MITRQQLIEVPVPENTRTYKSISHENLINLTFEGIDKSGFIVENESYRIAREGDKANGMYRLNHGDSEMGLMIAWQNSYDKSLSLKFAIGAQVFICENGMVIGSMGTFKKKHQGTVQEFTAHKISEYIKGAEDTYTQMLADRQRLKEVETTKKISSELIGRMLIDDAIITSTQVGIIAREIQNPSYQYEAEGSMWQLYNHVTFSMKQDHPSEWMNRQIKVHDFFINNIN